MEKIKLVMTRNKDDEKDLFDMLGTKEDRKEFDRQFKNPKSNFKIAIVVDMWLTGFDVRSLIRFTLISLFSSIPLFRRFPV